MLKVNKYTTLTDTLAQGATSATLTSAVFDNSTAVPLVLEYDNTSKIEVITADISGTALTNIVRGLDGTADIEHAGTPKIGISSAPSAWGYYLKNDFTSIGARAYLGSTQSNIANNTPTKVALASETYDIGGNFASNKFTAPIAGYYIVMGHVRLSSMGDQKTVQAKIYVNNSEVTEGSVETSGTTAIGRVGVMDIIHLNANDYVELFVLHTNGDGTPDIDALSTGTYLTVHFLHP